MSIDQQYADALKELREVKSERDEYRNHLAVIAEMTGNAGDIGATHERVNALVEDLARHKRLFAATCQQLGSIQQALGSTVVGIEPALVRELVEEREALAAHVERMSAKISDLVASNRVDGRDFHHVLKDTPSASLARRDALKQAEALESCAREIMHDDSREWVRCASKKLRQQAEGHQ